MIPEIITGLVRSLLMVLSITLANHGITLFDAGELDKIAGYVTALIVVLFSVRAKLKVQKKLKTIPTNENQTPTNPNPDSPSSPS